MAWLHLSSKYLGIYYNTNPSGCNKSTNSKACSQVGYLGIKYQWYLLLFIARYRENRFTNPIREMKLDLNQIKPGQDFFTY